MYKDKEKQRETTRDRVRRYRNKDKALHPIMEALVDPIKRRKLEAVYRELVTHHVCEQLFSGCYRPIRFDEVGELLETTS